MENNSIPLHHHGTKICPIFLPEFRVWPQHPATLNMDSSYEHGVIRR